MHERCGMVSERGLLHMGNAKERIESGKAVLGIEFGSTRIKAVLVDETHQPIASGAHDWENQLVDGIWTYSLDMIWDGLRDCYRKMTEDVQNKYGVAVTKLGAIGFSGMMHGYMPFDEEFEDSETKKRMQEISLGLKNNQGDITKIRTIHRKQF